MNETFWSCVKEWFFGRKESRFRLFLFGVSMVAALVVRMNLATAPMEKPEAFVWGIIAIVFMGHKLVGKGFELGCLSFHLSLKRGKDT